ncbi:MAG: hypothetical protein U0003_05985 [Vampirovibrionales bacterium]
MPRATTRPLIGLLLLLLSGVCFTPIAFSQATSHHWHALTQPNISNKTLPTANSLKGHVQNTRWYQESSLTGAAWQSTNPQILKADALADAKKLGAAEALYRDLLTKHPNEAGAHRGLCQVSQLQTEASDATIRQATPILQAEAVQHCLNALRLAPNDAKANRLLAHLYRSMSQNGPSRHADAQLYAANAYRLTPHHSDTLTLVGTLLLDENQPTEALPLLKKATLANPQNAKAYLALGQAYAALQQQHNALQALNTAQWLAPQQPTFPRAELHHTLASLYHQQNNQAAAENHWKEALRLQPEYLPASLGLAHLYTQRHDWPLALATLKNAYHSELPSTHPQRIPLALQIGQVALYNQQGDVAEMYFNLALHDNPEALSALEKQTALQGLSSAQLLQAQQTLIQANAYGGDLLSHQHSLQQLQQSLINQPSNLKATLIQAKLNGQSRSLNDFSDREQHALLNALPTSSAELLTEGELWTARFEPYRAERSYSQALQVARSAEDTLRIGETLLILGEPQLAQQAFTTAIQRNTLSKTPQSIVALACQAGLKKAQQQLLEASQSLEQAQRLGSKHPEDKEALLANALQHNQRLSEAHYQLAVAYQNYSPSASTSIQAIRHYHAFIQLAPHDPRRGHAQKAIAQLTERTALLKAETPAEPANVTN